MPQHFPPTEKNRTLESVSSAEQVVVFLLEGQRYGLKLATTERVLPAVALTALPRAPGIVLGVFSLRGQIVPVLDIRGRFQLPRRALAPEQQMLVVHTSQRRVAILVDVTLGVVDVRGADLVPSGTILRELPYLRGIARTADGLVLIHDLDTFLALDEAAELEAALSAAEAATPP